MRARFFTLLLICTSLLAACTPAPAAPTALNVPVVVWKDNAGAITALAVQPGGRLVAAGNDRGGVRLWDVASGQIRATLSAQAGSVNHIEFTADGKRFATCGDDSSVNIWDVTSNALLFRVDIPGGGPIRSFAFNSDGTRMLVGGADRYVRYLDINRKGKEIKAFPGHTSAVTGVSWLGNTRRFASIGADNKYILWDVIEGSVVSSLSIPQGAVALQGSSDGHTFAVAGADGQVSIFDSVKLPVTLAGTFGAQGAINQIAYNAAGDRLAATYRDRLVRLYEPQFGKLVAELRGHTAEPLAAAWLDANRLLTGDRDGQIYVWTVGALRPPPTTPTTRPS